MPGGRDLQLALPFQAAHSSRPYLSRSAGREVKPPYRLRIPCPVPYTPVDEAKNGAHPASCSTLIRQGSANPTELLDLPAASGVAADVDLRGKTSDLALAPTGDIAEVLAVACALLPSGAILSRSECTLVRTLRSPPLGDLRAVRSLIQAGGDPLGDALCATRTAKDRRAIGAIFTPSRIVESMVTWAAAQGTPTRVVDPGAGSGRFVVAAAAMFPNARLVVVDSDPQALLVLRANAEVLGLSRRLTVLCEDYRKAGLEQCEGRTLFLGNPPYLRHHAITRDDKEWFARGALRVGLRASKLAGLHVHFFLRTMQLAQPGDYGAFVTAAEWLDVKYGSVLRGMLVNGLGGTSVHVLAADAKPFEAITTGAITTFHVGRQRDGLQMRTVASIGDLGNLEGGTAVSLETAARSPRWSSLARGDRPVAAAAGYIQLGELFEVHRGQVTGANDVWIAGGYEQFLPPSVLFPTVTRAREIIEARGRLDSVATLRQVVDLPSELETLDPADVGAVRAFIRWAKSHGADRPYVARHRRAWWSVGLKPPAPIICTYMARRPPTFAYNPHGVRHINIAHGLYPRQVLEASTLTALTRYLNANARAGDGRTYAGGLVKFEPSEIQRLYVPDPATLHGTA